jgi:transposase
MAKTLVDDKLWAIIQPMLPEKPRRKRYPGRKPIGNRAALTGILFVLKSGIGWEDLPLEMGCGSGVTCWRRLRDWQEAGVWERLHQELLRRLQAADRIDWSRAVADSSSVRAVFWGAQTGPNPTDRGKAGSKHHLLTDAKGVPLSFALTGANIHDSTQLVPMLAAIDGVRGKVGRPRRRPIIMQGDRAYGSRAHTLFLRSQGIRDLLAKVGQPHGSGLGKTRWVIERSLSWLHQFRRLRVRYERRADIHFAFLALGS